MFLMSAPAGCLLSATDAQRRECATEIIARFATVFDDIAIDIAWQSHSLNAQAFRLGPAVSAYLRWFLWGITRLRRAHVAGRQVHVRIPASTVLGGKA